MKTPLLCITLATLVNHVSAQELVSSDMNATVGLEFERAVDNFVNPGASGEGQVWDFSNLGIIQLGSVEITTLELTGLADEYLGSNYVFSNNNGTSYEFYSLSDTALNLYGQYEDVALELIFEDPQVILPFPASFGVTEEDEYSGVYSFNGTPATISGTATMECDGTGTLILPWGTIENTLRVRTDVVQTEVLSPPGSNVTLALTGEVYSWYAAGFPGPLVITRDLESSNGTSTTPIQITGYISEIATSTSEISVVEDLNVYPNPAVNNLNISFENQQAKAIRIDLLDLQGRLVKSIPPVSYGNQSNVLELSVNDLAKGAYVLRLSDDENIQQRVVVVGQ